jgi:hypothetical protein
MALAHTSDRSRRRRGANPLAAPILLFVLVLAAAAAYVGYVLWPRWPDVPVAPDAPAIPIVIGGTSFVIEPAAIRMPVQRHPGRQDRVDLAYDWPALLPARTLEKPAPGAPQGAAERLFVTVQMDDGTLAPMQRVETIYPRYLGPQPAAGPAGLTLRAFRDDTPYKDEDLLFDPAAPAHFLARCARHGAVGPGHCLLERRIGHADVTFRFPRDWLDDWPKVADAVDALMHRLHPD